MEDPSSLSTVDLLQGIISNRVECKGCSAVNDYDREYLIEELAERIEGK